MAAPTSFEALLAEEEARQAAEQEEEEVVSMDTWERSCRMAFPLRGEGRAARFVITVEGESREVAAAMRNYLFA